jgi:hypothetical protein
MRWAISNKPAQALTVRDLTLQEQINVLSWRWGVSQESTRKRLRISEMRVRQNRGNLSEMLGWLTVEERCRALCQRARIPWNEDTHRMYMGWRKSTSWKAEMLRRFSLK